MPDNIVELSLFMCVNYGYHKHKKSGNCLNRMFVLLLEAMAIGTLAIQFYLLYLLWAKGLGPYDTTSQTAIKNPSD